MKWRIVRRSRSFVRIELFGGDGLVGRQYIGIEGSISKGYRWYSGTNVLGYDGFEGNFKEVSQDVAIHRAVKLWKLRLQEIVNAFHDAEVPIPEPVEVKGEVSND